MTKRKGLPHRKKGEKKERLKKEISRKRINKSNRKRAGNLVKANGKRSVGKYGKNITRKYDTNQDKIPTLQPGSGP